MDLRPPADSQTDSGRQTGTQGQAVTVIINWWKIVVRLLVQTGTEKRTVCG